MRRTVTIPGRTSRDSESQRILTGEGFAVILLALSYLLMPLFADEFYPLFNPHLFCDSPQTFAKYELKDETGRSLNLAKFGLGNFYYGLNGYRPGKPQQHSASRKYPPTLNIFGEIAPMDQVGEEVKKHLMDQIPIRKVKITQTIFGPVGRAVGMTARNQLEVERSPK
jgi:hypothetical protein